MKFYLKDIRQVVYMSSKNKDLKYNDMQYVIMFHHTSSLLRLPITQLHGELHMTVIFF